MRLLIDTNVVLDFLADGENLDSEKQLFMLAETREEYECVTASAVTDMLYLFNRKLIEKDRAQEGSHKSRSELREEATNNLREFLSILHILPVSEEDIQEAFELAWDDFEDAVQYVVGLRNQVDVIITWNKGDFKKSSIPVMNPAEFIQSRSGNETPLS